MREVKRVSVDFTVNMLSDFHVGSGAGVAGVADRAVLRTASKELFIAGSTIKGRSRHHCEQLARSFGLSVCGGRGYGGGRLCKDDRSACIICRIYGSEWTPGPLRFSDARLSDSLREAVIDQGSGPSAGFDNQVSIHTRTRLNRKTRAVERGALYTFEEGAEGLSFKGEVSGTVPSVTGSAGFPVELVALIASLRLIDRLGGKKTVGLGECSVTIGRLSIDGEESRLPWQEALESQLEELVLYDEYRAG